MATDRHAKIADIVADVKTRLTALSIFEEVTHCQATSIKDIARVLTHAVQLPAAVVVAGTGEYPRDDPMAPPQRLRELDIGVIIVGTYDVDPDAGADDVWALEDAVDRSFTPGPHAAEVTINGVIYEPAGTQPIALDENRAARMLTLRTIDPVQSRSDP